MAPTISADPARHERDVCSLRCAAIVTDIGSRNPVEGGRMRRVTVVAVIAAILLTFIASAASAEPIKRYYKGETSQGHTIRFKTAVRANGQVRVGGMDLMFEGICEDSTSFDFGYGITFGGRSGPVLADGVVVDIDESLGNDALHVDGQIRRRHGSGTLQFVYATLTEDEQAQLCTTGDITWEVDRVAPPSDATETDPSAVTRVVRNGRTVQTFVTEG
jgi:hypothetical protein